MKYEVLLEQKGWENCSKDRLEKSVSDEEAFFGSITDSKFWKSTYFVNFFFSVFKHVEGRPLEK